MKSFFNSILQKTGAFIIKKFGIEAYLRFKQRGFFLAYKTGLLRNDPVYYCHYYAKRLINRGDTVLDIGANLGYYSILFADWVGTTGKVLAVEPIALYNKIFNEKARKFKNIRLYPYALGLEEKQVELVTDAKSNVLSTGLPHVFDPQTDGQLEDHDFRFKAQMKIPSRLFGDLEKLDYIKCDIEGLEGVVLTDLKAVIARHRPIVQVEVWHDSELPIRRMFDELGYRAYKLDKTTLVPQTEHRSRLGGDYFFMPEKK
jgi:FkbM family methyltransferase